MGVLLLYFVALPLFALIAVAMIGSPDSEIRGYFSAPVIGAIVLAFCAVAFVFVVATLTVRRTVLIVDDRGIRSPRSGFAFEWSSIEALYVGSYQGGRFGPTIYVLGVQGVPWKSGWRLPFTGFNAAMMGLPSTARRHRVTWQIGTRPRFPEAIKAIRAASPDTPIF
ncbi:PH domain-containing protein OS=Tsukamurella paurometabola (strain ATCC 8368 / DSM / CCUG 35730/ CIP 100753 / JCM 10117 / KCTC 9821 / NBRC 16120 / NCIMB 702349 / NCTC 13040) OX=521096 GN=Tpau_2949 PE=4 SV=1 [Tsukamurella paurometabola]|uniref:PH domain-containing protein n=1 Tax=Tsukamurella paurometabola (strain ATCC 8368 / DSM 20162 / CCUG 35730 / CIP 100753 / JCM 10117 / KCTC 9821 / NBRC 16120 / NCIMB 702349 / NCTC 13040) TaxID=521096 RepID=D5UU44_TSUPD|nr:hypothetical protein [Tsukamurella paurometabola]ADG79547.1 hypothetical protein Tpau_2949 [Tsukamurella paurometabola DSM 20162]SUP36175.1 Uncharacterised protein [Tsukamurella paurometabola]